MIEKAVRAHDTAVPSASKDAAISPKATKLIEKFSAVSTIAAPIATKVDHDGLVVDGGSVGDGTPLRYTRTRGAVETARSVCQTPPMGLLGLIVPGLIVGVIARMIVPTGRRYGCLGTILLGIVGSLVGGTLASVVAGDGLDVSTAGWIGSVIGAVIVLLVVRWNDSKVRR